MILAKSGFAKGCAAAAIMLSVWAGSSLAQKRGEAENGGGKGKKGATQAELTFTQILGRPTDHSIAVSLLAPGDLDVYVEYGEQPGKYAGKTAVAVVKSAKPTEINVDGLKPNAEYFYRVQQRKTGGGSYTAGPEYSFHTQRTPGATFSFGVQGDSHPERVNNMYNAELYQRTMQSVREAHPDFYIMLGDDFNVDGLYNSDNLNAQGMAGLYINQRHLLGMMASAVPLFHVNGNHEQASAHSLDGTPNSPGVVAGIARNAYLPLPLPDAFYSGDKEPVEFVGLRRDYYAWTWGDALFVTIDPYWHSPVQVDAGIGGQVGRKKEGKEGKNTLARDGWASGMGDAQYQWLKTTLEQSHAKYKFVFSHHVLGTGRGGVEVADLYEWGGRNKQGVWEFDKKRPGWELPVHQLMVRNGVTIFFQGHDHLYARQMKDGLVYQETPNPADDTYTIFNKDAYRSGDVLGNSGFLRVTVSPENTKVDYIRSWMPKDETAEHKQGEIAISYTVPPARLAKK
jgi:Calcineurin-like phosphoesterase